MLENMNDYISFIVMIVLLIAGLKLMISLNSEEKQVEKKYFSIIFDYENNEDE